MFKISLKRYIAGFMTVALALSGIGLNNIKAYAAETISSVSISEGKTTLNYELVPYLKADISPADATVTYQWYKDGIDASNIIDGATYSSYFPTKTLSYGKYETYYVKVTGTGDYSGEIMSDAFVYGTNIKRLSIENNNDEASRLEHKEGETVEAKTTISPSGATAAYQWYSQVSRLGDESAHTGNFGGYTGIHDGYEWKAISGATGSTYTIPADFKGLLRVVATGTGDYVGDIYADNAVYIVKEAPEIEISNANAGETATANILKSGYTASYQWYLNGTDEANKISGATSSTYDIPLGTTGTLYVVASNFSTTGTDTYTIVEGTSTAYAVLSAQEASVSLSGTGKVGEVLTATVENSNLVDDGMGVSVKWLYEDGTEATTSTGDTTWSMLSGTPTIQYTVKESDAGKKIYCKIIGMSTIESNTIEIEAQEASVSLSGTGKIGEVLTATVENGNLVDDGMGVSIKWLYEDGTEATTSTGDTTWTMLSGTSTIQYTVKEADAGKKIHCKIIGMSTIESNTIEIEAPVKQQNISLTIPSVIYAGNSSYGTDVWLRNLYNDDYTSGTIVTSVLKLYDYQWYLDDQPVGDMITSISSFTNIKYRVYQSDIGKTLKLKATAKDGSGEGWSNEASIVDVTSTVEIVGTPKVGETLTASPTPEYTDNDLNKGYTAWFIDGVRVTDYIYTRTGKDFVVPEGTEAGSKIKVLTFINDLGTYIESPEVTVLASDTDTPETPSTIRIPDSIENVEYQDVVTTEAFNRTVTEGDVLVYVSQGQNFIVKLPKRIVMDGSKAASTVDFNTMVTANISGYDTIHVEPEADSLKLKESTGVKKDIDCNLSIGQTLFSVKDDTQEALEAGKVANHSASVTNLSAGSWRGTFNWHISVDGKLYSNSQENVE